MGLISFFLACFLPFFLSYFLPLFFFLGEKPSQDRHPTENDPVVSLKVSVSTGRLLN